MKGASILEDKHMVFLITLTKSCVDKYQVGGCSYEAYYEVSLLSAIKYYKKNSKRKLK